MPQQSSATRFPLLEGPPHPLGRRIAYLLLVAAVSVITGFSLALVKIPLVVGALLSILCATLLFRNLYLGLIAYTIVYALRLGEVYPVLAPLRMERVIGALTFLGLILTQLYRNGRVSVDWSRQTRHFLILIAAASLTIPLAYWRLGAINGLINFIKYFLFYLLIVQLVDSRPKLRGFVYLHLSLVLYIAVDSVVHYVRGALLHAQGIDRALGTTSIAAGPNELGATMACSIPVFLYFFLRRRGGLRRFAYGGALVLCVATLVLTGSRSALLGFLGSMGYFWWRSNHRVLLGMVGLVLIGAMFVAMPEQYQGRYSTITSSNLDGSSQERLKVWAKGMRMFASRPVAGVGVGCFGTANAADFSGAERASWLESHSLYVQVLAEMGIIGALAFFSYVLCAFRANRRILRRLKEDDEDDWDFEIALLNGMFGGFVALIFTGVFGHSLMRDTWYIYPAIAVTIGRLYLKSRDDLPEDAQRRLLGVF